MDLIGPSLKGQQNGLAGHKSKHGALKNFSHNASLRKLTTNVKALGVTAPPTGDPHLNLWSFKLGFEPGRRNWDQH